MSKNSEYLIERENKQYEVIIGLEVHAQVTSQSKFSLNHQQNLVQNQTHKLVS